MHGVAIVRRLAVELTSFRGPDHPGGPPEASKNQNPDVSWNEIRGLRNIIAHIYFDINKEQIWETIQDDLPVLKSQILSILNDLERKNI